MAFPAYRGKTENAITASGTAVSLTSPAGTISGDYQIVVLSMSSDSVTLGTTPAGWALLTNDIVTSATSPDRGGTHRIAIYESTTATGTFSMTLAGSARIWAGVRMSWTKPAGSAGRTIALAKTIEPNGTAPATKNIPSIANGNTDSLAVAIGVADYPSASLTWTVPATPYTSRSVYHNGSSAEHQAIAIADRQVTQNQTGITGTLSVNPADESALYQLIINGTVSATPPTVDAGADANAQLSAPFTRTAGEITGGAAITSRSWSIFSGPAGAGTTLSTTTTVNWTPTVLGTYVLRYSATNSQGSDIDDVTITVVAVDAAANLTASGDVAVGGTITKTSGVDLTASGGLTADATPTRQAAAALTGAGSLTVAGTPSRAAGASLTAQGSLSASATPVRRATAALTATGALTIDARQTSRVPINMVGQATLTAVANVHRLMSAALTAQGTLSADGRPVRPAATALTAQGTLTVTAIRTAEVSASLTGTLTHTFDLRKQVDGLFIARGRAIANLIKTRGLTADTLHADATAVGDVLRLAIFSETLHANAEAEGNALRIGFPRALRMDAQARATGIVRITAKLPFTYIFGTGSVPDTDTLFIGSMVGRGDALSTVYPGDQRPIAAVRGRAEADAIAIASLYRATRGHPQSIGPANGLILPTDIGRIRPMYMTPEAVHGHASLGGTRNVIVFHSTVEGRATIEPPNLQAITRFYGYVLLGEGLVKERQGRFVETTAYGLGGGRLVHDRWVRTVRGYVTAIATATGELHDAPVRHPAVAQAIATGDLMPVRHLDQFVLVHARIIEPSLAAAAYLSSVIRVITGDEIEDFHEVMPPFGEHTHTGYDSPPVYPRTFTRFR